MRKIIKDFSDHFKHLNYHIKDPIANSDGSKMVHGGQFPSGPS